MDAAWQVLRNAGVPLEGGPRDAGPPVTSVADAVRKVVAETPMGREAEALAAFVLGWSQHWPSTYASAFDGDGPDILAWAERQLPDPNRYLKLRRIAIAHLATRL